MGESHGQPIADAAHEMTYRVCYGDTDRMGRVYYANYLVFAERARTELLRAAGYSYRLVEEDGFALPVRRCTVRYFSPAFYDDELVFRSRSVARSLATVTVETEVFRPPATETLARVTVELACVDAAKGKPAPLPDRLLAAMERFAVADWRSAGRRREGR